MPTPANAFDVSKLLVGFVDLLAAGTAMPGQFERLARELSIPEGEPTVVFLSGLKKILRELPDKAFDDKNARFAMVDAVQDALDNAIDAEEEMNENDEKGST